ncbi:MAG: hypothetical protein HRU09_15165 [Oligoflexales bacterium]|nr:hypothetical protein [Oligoflexales bacterium]
MKVYQFPRKTRKLEKKQKKQEPICNGELDSSLSKESLNEILQELEGWVKDQDSPAELIDCPEIDANQFRLFCTAFPCLKTLHGIGVHDVLAKYSAGKLTDQQDIAVELIFELLSSYNFGFDISEAFLAFAGEDRKAVIKVLSLYESTLN